MSFNYIAYNGYMNRTILITGASSGIGHAISQHLLEKGYHIIGLARDFSKSSCTHPNFTTYPIDLSSLEKLPTKLAEIALNHPTIDGLICNAGQGHFANLEQFSYPQIRHHIDLNFTSHAYTVRSFLPHLKKCHHSDILFMGSEAALQGGQKGSIYCAAKFALRGFAQALRQECSSSGIRITLLNPGMVQTPFFERLNFAPGKEPDQYIEAADIAQTVGTVLAARPGTVFDEINMSPLKKVIDFGKKNR